MADLLSDAPRTDTAPARPLERLALTAAQTGVWYAQRLDPGSAAHNTAQYVLITGPVDTTLLTRAIHQGIAETEALRARFVEDAGEVWQVVDGDGQGEPPRWELPLLDLGAEPDAPGSPADPLARAVRWMRAEAGIPVDLAAGPLFAEALLRTGPDTLVWYHRCHHILLDGYGSALLIRRVAEIYTALATGSSTVDSPFGGLRQVLLDEAAYRDSPRRARDREFWLAHLADAPEPVSLGTGPARPAAAAPHWVDVPVAADPVLAAADHLGVSWADVVIAAAAAYGQRMTGVAEPVLLLPMAARWGSAAARVPCMVANLLPLRLPDTTGLSAANLIKTSAAQLRQLSRHQHYRAEDIRREHRRVGAGRALTGLQVNIRHYASQVRFGDAQGVVHDIAPGPVDDLLLSCAAEPDGSRLSVRLAGNPAHYRPEELRTHHERFAEFLGTVATAAQRKSGRRRIGQLPLATSAERQRVLVDWNDTRRAVPATTLVELLEAQAARTPEATAVVVAGAEATCPEATCPEATNPELTYAELTARANHLAHLLLARGAGPGRLVALALPRSADLAVALLAVLKTGAAYLPLDLDYPLARLEFMLRDAAPTLVVTDLANADRLPAHDGRIVLDEAATRSALLATPATDPTDQDRPEPLTPAHPAYVIYTSGSTGTPKGVVVAHSAIVNRLLWMRAEYGVDRDDRVLQKTPLSFDVSVWEVFLPLLAGATVVLARPGGQRDSRYLAELIETERITTVHFVPSMLRVFLEETDTADHRGLRRVICSGEALTPDLVAAFHRRCAAELHNLYGPTEAAVDVSHWHCARGEEDAAGAGVPIGRPVWNTRLYVLDSQSQPLPPGAVGELHIAGVQLADGYLNRPELTAERFIADPFAKLFADPGAKMYRTGDLARWRSDGVLEFVGRADGQIKLRGVRIELGEIEAVLTDHAHVAAAVVLLREDRPADPQLVAYTVPAEGGTLDQAELRQHAANRLPEHLVPAAFVTLDAMPLTANGKLDRAALPAPTRPAPAPGRAPASATERALCALFAELLGVTEPDTVGVDDDFFALGGHSLLANRLVNRVRQTLGAELSIQDVFQAPTAAGLAGRLDQGRRRPPLTRRDRPQTIPLSVTQRRLWFLNQLEGPSPTYNMPLVATLPGTLDLDALASAFGDVLARHESLRTVFPEQDGVPRQRVLAPDAVTAPLEMLACGADELARRLDAARQHEFDLAADLPIWAQLLFPDQGDPVLVLVLHHIAGDGWSLAPLARDLSTAYRARQQGRPPRWAELPVQYVDYTLWQQEFLGDEQDPESVLARQLAYWTERLAGLPDELVLPTDHPRPVVAGYRGGLLTHRMPSTDHQALLDLATRTGTSLFMVLQAGLAALLTRLGAGTDIPLGTAVAARDDAALDELVGYFTNTLVLRVDTAGEPTFRQVLARVRQTALDAYAHQDVPFDRLVEAVNPERLLGRHPLFQVSLVLQNNESAHLDIGDGGARLEPSSAGTSRFDLLVNAYDRYADSGAPAGVEFKVEYASDLFERATVERITQWLARLLAEAAAEPDTPIADLPVLTGSERAWLDEVAPPPGTAWIGGHRIDLVELTRRLLAEDTVAECVVLPRRTSTGAVELVAYLVPAGPAADASRRAAAVAAEILPGAVRLAAVVPLPALPRTGSGRPDEHALRRLPVVDEELAADWERRLRAAAGVDQAAVVVLDEPAGHDGAPSPTRPTGPPHPAPASGPGADGEFDADGEPASAPPALLSGGPVVEPPVPDLVAALRRAASVKPRTGIVYIGQDGSATTQSYVELGKQARRVLGGLRRLGLRPGDMVVCQLRDNRELVSTVWAAVLGGFVVVPLGVPPTYDAASSAAATLDNVWRMLDRPVVVTSPDLVTPVRAFAADRQWTGARLVGLDELSAGPAAAAVHQPAPDEPVVMLLTSGSTGLPKAFTLTHRNILTRSAAAAHVHGLTSAEITVNWATLDHGGGLVMSHLRDVVLGCQQIQAPTDWVMADPLRWLDLIDQYRASTTWAPNFAYGLVAEQVAAGAGRGWDLSCLRLAMNIAEPVVARVTRRFLTELAPHGLAPDVVHASWGMSELATGITDQPFRLADTTDDDPFVSNGRPYPGMALRVVNEHGVVLPQGATGRLQARGVFVTPGYHANPAANQAAFTADGWFDSGDLAFIRDDQLFITGRVKDVIIINGVNHHSHEIEAVVEQLDCVERSFTVACAVRGPDSSTDELAIFFHPRRGADLARTLRAIRAEVTRQVGVRPAHLLPVAAEEIPKTNLGKLQRSRLRARFEAGEFAEVLRHAKAQLDGSRPAGRRLVGHVVLTGPQALPGIDRTVTDRYGVRVPADLVAVPALPLTPTGEVDRARLAASPAAPAEDVGGRRERELAAIWADVLGVERVGRDDDFFELGGHSLLVTRLVSRIRADLDVELAISDLFQAPTVASLAARLGVAGRSRPALRPVPRPDPVPLSFAQRRLWFLNRFEGPSPTYNIPIVLRMSGPLDRPALEAALADVVARHESLRTVLPDRGGVPHQHVLDPERSRPRLRTYEVPDDELDDEIRRVLRHGFDLTKDVPLRAHLFVAGPTDHVLVLVLHHVAGDGWSLEPLTRDLATAYAARHAGRPPRWSDLPAQYVDYTLWQRELLGDPADPDSELGRQLAYWTDRLAGLPEELPLPRDHARPARPSYRGARVQVRTSAEAHRALLALARQTDTSLFMVLQAGLAALLTRLGAGVDIPLGSPIAGRTDAALDELVGFFANTLVLRTDTSAEPTFRRLLARVRAADLAAYDHQDVPFDRLVEAVNPTRDPARHPLFQVCFAVQDLPRSVPGMPGLDVVIDHDVDPGVAKFDLYFAVSQRHTGPGLPAGLDVRLDYAADLFEPRTAEAVLARLVRVLERAAEDPDRTLDQLDDGPRVDLDAVADRVLAHDAVRECVVLPRRTSADTVEPVVYVVPCGAVATGQLAAAARQALPADAPLPPIVELTSLPRTADGAVDTAALERVPVVDEDLAARWEAALADAPGVDAVAVALRRVPVSTERVHLGDAAPSAAAPVQASPGQMSTVDAPAEPPDPRAVSVLHGPPLAGSRVRDLVTALRRSAEAGPQAEIVYRGPDGVASRQHYRELAEDASRVLGGLRGLGLRPGDKVIFQLVDNRDFLTALWACVLGGFVAVPLAVPPTYHATTGAEKLVNTWRMLDSPLVLTDQGRQDRLRGLAGPPEWAGAGIAVLDQLRGAAPDHDWHAAGMNDLALLVLTSGSTSLPKAVELRHGNVLAHAKAAAQRYGLTTEDVCVNWISLDHVGGVVMSHIGPLFAGYRQVHAPTSEVIADPLRWLAALDEHRATITWAPNFAFSLVADHAAAMAGRQWDLSALRLIINGGEALVPRVARRFLDLLAQFGLRPDAMHSVWGMSECSSAEIATPFTYPVSGDDDATFPIGRPYPGFSLRIVDDTDQVLPEGRPGRLQVRGAAVTKGYHNNPAQNQVAFTRDGWFDTGDLGVVRDGLLTLTGRAKDAIVINGVNYPSHELESLVEELDVVERSFTAACAVRAPGSATDQLAVFCHLKPDVPIRQAVELIRATLTRRAGIAPAFVLPVACTDIPKTEIGKIQRPRLRARFEAGEFAATAQRVDLLLENENTLPNWFFQPVWRPAAPPVARPTGAAGGAVVLLGVGEQVTRLAEQVERAGRHCVVVRSDAESHRLLDQLGPVGAGIDQVVDLRGWTRGDPGDGDQDVLSTVCELAELVTALDRWHAEGAVVTLRVLTTEVSVPASVLRTASAELPWLRAQCVELAAEATDRDLAQLVAELAVPPKEPEIALRDGLRLVRRLRGLPAEPPAGELATAIQPGQWYVVSGGLGGVAVEVARHLLTRYGVRLLLLGRTALDTVSLDTGQLDAGQLDQAERSTGNGTRPSDSDTGELAPAEAKAVALNQLRALGEVSYATVDVADAAAVRAAVASASRRWGGPPAGVFHLAGEFVEHRLVAAPPRHWRQALAAKVAGALALHEVVRDRPGALFVSFSSVNGFFGGASVAGYAAASAFLDALARRQRAAGLRSYSLAWSMWDEVGMSRGYPLRSLAEARGYRVLPGAQAVRSLDAVLRHAEPHVLIGLDPAAPWVLGHLDTPARPLVRLTAWLTEAGASAAESAQPPLADRFGTAVTGEVVVLDQLPRTATGQIDRTALVTGRPSADSRTDPADAPDGGQGDEVERVVSTVWCEVLGRDRVGRLDNFFDLGGHSLLAAKLQARLAEELRQEVSLVDLFTYPTVAQLAEHLRPAPPGEQGPGRPAPGARLRKAVERAQRQRRAARRGRGHEGTLQDDD
ncbi:non-ribosomal peptide synthetase [Goodfellowiella coeruleoviolacea]|uniref:Amino acid adenylation domain-containing protein n=1 Tax=Goodfellowiella coeruleoviolacea TaxID=334858 RepID=A0AAE3G9B8_9PSEU|nr:non-ribosomal peptide synthetase [Goodfellowiella coeruleoviolacea]MCP2163945.1 amino acid adenylation domain-containing protein [Goodfellowiella coeruleoviolacea]